MDKLLQNWSNELIPSRVWSMATTQNKSSHRQTVEETTKNIYKSSENKPENEVWF